MNDAIDMKQLTIQNATNASSQIVAETKSTMKMEHVDLAPVDKNQTQMIPKTENAEYFHASTMKDVRTIEMKMVNADQILAGTAMKISELMIEERQENYKVSVLHAHQDKQVSLWITHQIHWETVKDGNVRHAHVIKYLTAKQEDVKVVQLVKSSWMEDARYLLVSTMKDGRTEEVRMDCADQIHVGTAMKTWELMIINSQEFYKVNALLAQQAKQVSLWITHQIHWETVKGGNVCHAHVTKSLMLVEHASLAHEVKCTKVEDVCVITGQDVNLMELADQMFVTTDQESYKVFSLMNQTDHKENVYHVIQEKHLQQIAEAAHALDQVFWIG